MTDFTPHSHIPFGEDGSGYYTDNTAGCFNVLQEASPAVMKAVESIPVTADSEEAFSICDFGTADGGISLFLIKDVIGLVKSKYGAKKAIHVIYEDQPVNDFKSVFLRVHGLIPGSPTYMKEFSDIYVSACGTGFYDQCLPSGSLNLSLAFTCLHWLYERPCQLTDSIHHVMCGVPEERQKFKDQAAKDWEMILLHRARELKSGGQMVIANLGIDNEGQHLGKTKRVKHSMFEVMTRVWKRLVTKEEFINTTFNNYYRTIAESRAPFDDSSSAVTKAGLKLVSIETKVVKCPYNEAWLASGKCTDDMAAARRHAAWFVPTTRTWSNSTFRSALSDTRSDKEKDSVVNIFFKQYENEVAQAPEDHAMDYVHVYMTIKKSEK